MGFGDIASKAKDLGKSDKVKEGLDKAADALGKATSGKGGDEAASTKDDSKKADSEAGSSTADKPREQLYRGKARGATLKRTGDAGGGKHTYTVTDPAGSDLKSGQEFTLAEDQVEKL